MPETEKLIEKKIEIEQKQDGTIEKTQTGKEITTPQGQPQQQTHTVETPQPAARSYKDYDFDPMIVLLWVGIAGAVIWLIFSHRRNR